MTLTSIRKNENISVAIDCNDGHRSGWLEINAGLAACFVDLVVDCGDRSEGRELYGNIRASQSSLSAVIRQGGFTQCDYGLADFMLSDYDKRVTLPAVLLWYHGREYIAEESRLDGIFEAAMLAKLNGGTPEPEPSKIRYQAYQKTTAN